MDQLFYSHLDLFVKGRDDRKMTSEGTLESSRDRLSFVFNRFSELFNIM